MPKNKSQKIKTGKKYRTVIISFASLAILLFIFIIYYSFSKTVIYVTLKQKPIERSFFATIYETPTEEELALENSLQGKILVKEISQTETFNDLGEAEEIPAQAQGRVTIYNNWNHVQPLMAGTRLLSEKNILFRTKERVDIPPKSSIETEVYADQAGPEGNIGPSKFSIPGLSSQMQELVWAESKENMTGGLKKVHLVSNQLVQEKQNEILNKIKEEGFKDFEKELERDSDYSLSKDRIEYEILEKNITPAIGSEANEFTLYLKVKLIAIAFSENNLKNTAFKKLSESIDPNYQINSDFFALKYNLENFNLNEKTASLKVTAQAKAHLKLSSPIFNRENLTNKDRQEIRAYFLDQDDVKEVEVKFSPFWVFRSPALKDHIEIRFK